MIPPTDLKKFDEKEGPDEDVLIPLSKENKLIIGRKREREIESAVWKQWS